MNNTVNNMKNELYTLIINHLMAKARPSMSTARGPRAKEEFRKYVHDNYLQLGRPLNLELTPYFQLDDPLDEHEKMVDSDLDVLIGIASKLGYVLEINWTRR